jgi:HAD superfamily hydrolase (TIGR01549 family)
MLKAVVFDVGETLVNETRLWRAWANWLGVSELAFFAVLGSFIDRGENHRQVFEVFRPGFDLEAARRDREAAGIPDEFELGDFYPDAVDCLRELSAQGLRVGIAGNRPQHCERVLGEAGFPVDFVASSARWGVEKPFGEFFERIVRELQLQPNEVAYVGDRVDNDVLPAAAAGLVSVFLRRGPWGFIQSRQTAAGRADVRIDGLAELTEALRRFDSTRE